MKKYTRTSTKRYIGVIVFLLVALFFYIYIVYSNYTNNRDLLLTTVRQNQIQLVKAYKRKIDEKLFSKKRVIKATAEYIKTKDKVDDYLLIKQTLALTIKSGNFRSVYIGYADDSFITGISWIAPKWYKVTQREWYKEVEKSQQIVVTKPYMDSDLNSNVISIATPLYKEDKLYAVLSSDIKIDDFRRDILSLMPVKEGFAFMMTKQGDVVLRPSEFGFNIQEDYLKKIINDFISISSGVKTYNINGKNYIFTFDSLKNSDWIFITVLDENKIFEKLNTDLTINLLIAFVLALIGLSGFIYTSTTQRKLYENVHLLELFAKSSTWGVLMTNEEGKIVYVNKFYEKIFSLKNKSLYEENILNAKHILDNKLFSNNQEHFFINAKKNPKDTITYNLKKNNLVYNFQITPLLRANRDFEGIIITVMDITKEVALKQKEQKQEKIFIQNSKMVALGEMVSAISHQWRQPLSTLLLLVSNLEEMIPKKEMPKAYEYLTRSRSSIELMNETIQAFRNFYKENLEEKKYNIHDTITEINLIISPLLQMNGVLLEVTYDKNANYNTFGYPTYLKQVLLNLISNAKDELLGVIKKDIYREAKIQIYLEKKDKNFIIKVEDTGDGIKKETALKIFEPLFTTKGEEGTGTGLHLCKLLIEDKMNGKIYLDNGINPTRFIIQLKDQN